jgi:hypothetical protein
MSSRPHGRRASKLTKLFRYLVAISGAVYLLIDLSNASDKRSDAVDIVITANQKNEFLTYVKRLNIASDLRLLSVSVGDVLPDSGVRYFEIPLYYGAPFYRWATIGGKVVIVDRATRRVVEAID